MKEFLAILGSPHKNGITAAMLECAVSAAKAKSFRVHRVYLYEKHLAFCSGCGACLQTGSCVQKGDDLPELVSLLKSCDVVALAAPTYWANVPAAVKNLFDRLRGTAMEETKAFPKPRFSPHQRYLLLTSCNTPFPFSWLCGQSRGSLRAMEEFFRTSGMKPMGKLVCSGAKGKTTLSPQLERRILRCLK